MLTSVRDLIAVSLLAGCGLAATPAFADETDPPSEFTVIGYVQGVSDYRFRGVSRSRGNPAIQGGIELQHASGFYVGAWASNIDFGPALEPLYDGMEFDLYGGWTKEVASGLTADVGLRYYAFPGGHVGKAEYFEPYASLTAAIGPATAKLGIAYAPSQDSLGNDDNSYVFTDLGASIPNTPVALSAHLGYTSGARSPNVLTLTSTDGGFDYSVGATFAASKNLSVGVSYIAVDGNSFKGFSDDTVVGTLKLSF